MAKISVLQRFKSDLDDDWLKTFGHLNYLQQKMQQIDQIIGGLQESITFETEEVQADLILIKSILLQVNNVFDKHNKNFATARDPNNKHPQYPTTSTTTENTKTNTENMCAKDLKKARKGKKRGKTACAKKDTLTSTKPIDSGIGKELMQKMGWSPGEGLGKDKSGILTPILVEVKNNRLGLATESEKKAKKSKVTKPKNEKSQAKKQPVSILEEIATQRKWPSPNYDVVMENVKGRCVFVATLNLNGVEYNPKIATNTKKEAKKVIAEFCLQQIGILPTNTDKPNINFK